MTIKEAQELVDAWISKHPATRNKNELTNMAALTEEVGELARVIANKHGDPNYEGQGYKASMADELADVMWVLISLANNAGVDLTEALIENLTKKSI